MRTSKTRIAVLAVVATILSVMVVAGAQQPARPDADWLLSVFAQPVQVEWVARDRVRLTVAGQASERLVIEAASLTTTTNGDELHILAEGHVTVSSPLQQMVTAESLDMTFSRDGRLGGSLRR